jgi:hypothetical protein
MYTADETPNGQGYPFPAAMSTYPPPPPYVPPPPKSSRKLWLWLVPLIGLVMAGAIAPFVLAGHGPSLEDAQRGCRTAMNAEMSERAASANSDTDYAIGTVTGIELQETEETDGGYVIYGEAKVEITGAFGSSAHSAVLLKCTAHTGDDGVLHTSVSNR